MSSLKICSRCQESTYDMMDLAPLCRSCDSSYDFCDEDEDARNLNWAFLQFDEFQKPRTQRILKRFGELR